MLFPAFLGGIPIPAHPAGILFPADLTVGVADLAGAGILFPADLAEPVTVGVTDLDVAGTAPLAVNDVFTELELVTMKVADEVETVDGISVYYGGDYAGLWNPEFDDVGYIGNFDGQFESSEYKDPWDFFTMSGCIGVISTRRMDLMALSRMMGRPSRLFLIVRL